MGGSSDSDSDSLDGEPLTQLPSPAGAAAAVEVGARVAKYFGDELYFGTASSYDAVNEFWFVNYDDGDEEEFEQEEFEAVKRLYRKHKDKDPRVRQLAKEKKERRRKEKAIRKKEINESKRMQVTKKLPKYAGGNRRGKEIFGPVVLEGILRAAGEGASVSVMDCTSDSTGQTVLLRATLRSDAREGLIAAIVSAVGTELVRERQTTLLTGGGNLELDIRVDMEDFCGPGGAEALVGTAHRPLDLPPSLAGVWLVPNPGGGWIERVLGSCATADRGAVLIKIDGMPTASVGDVGARIAETCSGGRRSARSAVLTVCVHCDADLGGIDAVLLVRTPRRRDGKCYRGPLLVHTRSRSNRRDENKIKNDAENKKKRKETDARPRSNSRDENKRKNDAENKKKRKATDISDGAFARGAVPSKKGGSPSIALPAAATNTNLYPVRDANAFTSQSFSRVSKSNVSAAGTQGQLLASSIDEAARSDSVAIKKQAVKKNRTKPQSVSAAAVTRSGGASARNDSRLLERTGNVNNAIAVSTAHKFTLRQLIPSSNPFAVEWNVSKALGLFFINESKDGHTNGKRKQCVVASICPSSKNDKRITVGCVVIGSAFDGKDMLPVDSYTRLQSRYEYAQSRERNQPSPEKKFKLWFFIPDNVTSPSLRSSRASSRNQWTKSGMWNGGSDRAGWAGGAKTMKSSPKLAFDNENAREDARREAPAHGSHETGFVGKTNDWGDDIISDGCIITGKIRPIKLGSLVLDPDRRLTRGRTLSFSQPPYPTLLYTPDESESESESERTSTEIHKTSTVRDRTRPDIYGDLLDLPTHQRRLGALSAAAQKGHYREVMNLLQRDISPSQVDFWKKRPIEYVQSHIAELEAKLSRADIKKNSTLKSLYITRALLKIWCQADHTIKLARNLTEWKCIELSVDLPVHLQLSKEGKSHVSSDSIFFSAFADGEVLEPSSISKQRGKMPCIKLDKDVNEVVRKYHVPYLLAWPSEYSRRKEIRIDVYRGKLKENSVKVGTWQSNFFSVRSLLENSNQCSIKGVLSPTRYLLSGNILVKIRKCSPGENLIKTKRDEVSKNVRSSLERIKRFESESGIKLEVLPQAVTVSLLHAAIYISDFDLVDKLLNQGVDPRLSSKAGTAEELSSHIWRGTDLVHGTTRQERKKIFELVSDCCRDRKRKRERKEEEEEEKGAKSETVTEQGISTEALPPLPEVQQLQPISQPVQNESSLTSNLIPPPGQHLRVFNLVNESNISQVYQKIFEKVPLNNCAWCLRKDGENKFSMMLLSPAMEEEGRVYKSSGYGGRFVNDGWWYKDQESAKNAAFMLCLESLGLRGVITPDLMATKMGKDLFTSS